MAEQLPSTRMPVRVRYHECDPSGMVFHANFLTYANMASFEWFSAMFGSYSNMAARGISLVTAESHVRFHASCRFEDELVVQCGIEHIGNTSMTLRLDILRAEQLVAVVVNRYVWTDLETLRPVAPPEDIKAVYA